MPHKDRAAYLAYLDAYRAKHRPSPAPVEQGDGLPPIGQIVYSDDGTKVQCHVCGRWLGALNTHIKTHGLDGDSYKERYGLARGASLLPPATQERYREVAAARNLGETSGQYLPPPRPRAKGIEVRLSSRIEESAQRKGRRRG
ncbi:MucR family transcriptional regulator [Magnetospirillum fulvum]|uniref:MucR family transcriptional regulator n=1 Tax=Magnetospirillum fulvum MGU-K5 TaxID=1316936 RepID=S9SFI7_MAGFU|nr:MucR family transcriptional regulator [Magnetospirillum fulvum]EPY03504.1 hypothetical protein K678_00295 [Magnetospirillum fulvum MGU-K5]